MRGLRRATHRYIPVYPDLDGAPTLSSFFPADLPVAAAAATRPQAPQVDQLRPRPPPCTPASLPAAARGRELPVGDQHLLEGRLLQLHLPDQGTKAEVRS